MSFPFGRARSNRLSRRSSESLFRRRLLPLRARVHVGSGAVAPGMHRIEFLVHAHDDPAVFVRAASVFVVR